MRLLHPGQAAPWIIAHRGDSAAFPENTLAAFDAAVAAGADGIELDLQATRDGVPIVHHDATLRRLGGGARSVGSFDLAEVRALRAGVPTLDDVLDRYGGRTRLLLEIKAHDDVGDFRERARSLAERTVREVRHRRLDSSVQILSFDPAVLEAARAASSHVRTVLNLARLPRLDASHWRRLAPLFALSVDVRALTPAFVREAHRRGKPVLVYTCNTPGRALAALRAGADAIMSDRPGWLARLVETHPR